MAKFKQGDLYLKDTQKIILGDVEATDDGTGMAINKRLAVSGSGESSIEFTTTSGNIGVNGKSDLIHITTDGALLDGHMALGADAALDFPGYPTYESLLNINETFGASIVGGYGINLIAYGTADSASASLRGMSCAASQNGVEYNQVRGIYGAGYTGIDNTTTAALYGIYGKGYLAGNNSTATNIIGGYFGAGAVFSMTTATGTNVIAGQFAPLDTGSGDFNVTNAYGVKVETPGATFNGTLTNLYGLYIEDMTASSMTFGSEYNIYSAGASSLNYFAGDITFGGTISGTGDIYCNDLHTAGTSLYVGTVEVQDSSGDLKVLSGAKINGTFDVNDYTNNPGTEHYIYCSPAAAEDWVGIGLSGDDSYIYLEGSSGDIWVYTDRTGSDVKINADNEVDINAANNRILLSAQGATRMTVSDIINFYIYTISGTGDIYCGDLYTAGSSLYIGDVQLTSAANVLSIGGSSATTKFTLDQDNDYFELLIGGLKTAYLDADYLVFGIDDAVDMGLYWDVNTGEFALNANNGMTILGSYPGTTSLNYWNSTVWLKDTWMGVTISGHQMLTLEKDFARFGRTPYTSMEIDEAGSITFHVTNHGTPGEDELTINLSGVEVRQNISFTTSGTSDIGTAAIPAGNIYCNDLYTSGNSIHLGDLRLSHNGSVFNIPSNILISGTLDVNNYIGTSGAENFIYCSPNAAEDWVGMGLAGDNTYIFLDGGDETIQILSAGICYVEADNSLLLRGTNSLRLTGAGNNIYLNSDGFLFGANTISGTGDIYCNDLHTAGSSIFLGDLQLSYDSGTFIIPSEIQANNFIPTASGTSSIGSETLPYVQVYLADQATGDVYSVTIVSGTLVATIV